MPTSLGLGLGLTFLQGSGTPNPITADTAPTLAALDDTETPGDGFTSGTYSSTAGTIDSEVATYYVNGSPEASSYDLTAGDSVRVTELVTDSATNTRNFSTVTVVVSSTASGAFSSAFSSAFAI